MAIGVDDWVLAVPAGDDELVVQGPRLGVLVASGDERDVLSRFADAARRYPADAILRITADCPLIDPVLISHAISSWLDGSYDYFSYEGYPRGAADIEIVSSEALLRADTECEDPHHREHVTPHMISSPDAYRVRLDAAPFSLYRPELRVCVDEPADLELVRRLVGAVPPDHLLLCADIVRLLDEHPEWKALNQHVRQRS